MHDFWKYMYKTILINKYTVGDSNYLYLLSSQILGSVDSKLLYIIVLENKSKINQPW